MSLAAQLASLATRIGQEIKGLVRPTHPGLARAWVNFGYAANAVRLGPSYNVASVTRLAAGQYRVTFAAAFADTDYCWVASARSDSGLLSVRYAAARGADAKSAGALDLVCTNSSGTLADTSEMNLVVFR
jgi:hypothetical protein